MEDDGYILWLRVGGQNGKWKVVGRYATASDAESAKALKRKFLKLAGKWLVLPAGQQPPSEEPTRER